MNKKKKKTYVSQERKDAEGYKAFSIRIKVLCEKMVGPGYFELLSPAVLRQLYATRYRPIKLVSDDGTFTDEEEKGAYKASFSHFIKRCHIELLSGEKIPLYTLFSDVAHLIHFVEFISADYVREHHRLRMAFEPYFMSGQWIRMAIYHAFFMLSMVNDRFYDMYKGTLQFISDELAIIKPGGINEIRLHRLKHTFATLEIQGVKRPIVRIGNITHHKQGWDGWIMVSPEQLGITDMKDNSPKPLYIQQHALNRFEERTYCPQGQVQFWFAYVFLHFRPKAIVRNEHVLIEFTTAGYKAGYFVVSFHGDKWLVRTFLFLTNEGTPEGAKLKELAGLEREDTKYLMIDQIGAFLQYDMEKDTRLRSLLEEAGCASLFGYAKLFKGEDDEFKSAEQIASYLFKAW